MAESGRINGDDELAVMLACGSSIVNASRETGVSERTIYRRLADPGFRDKVHEIRRAALEEATGRLSAASSKAIQTMEALMDADVPASTRLAACRAILEFGSRYREVNEFESRLSQLESGHHGKAASAVKSP